MKYYLLLLTIVCLSCSKNNHEPSFSIDAWVVNDEAYSDRTTFAAGQYLKIAPSFANGRPALDFSWTLDPAANELIEKNNLQIVWRPAKSRQYTLGVNVQSSSGEQASSKYTFNIIPADIRYYLWGDRRS